MKNRKHLSALLRRAASALTAAAVLICAVPLHTSAASDSQAETFVRRFKEAWENRSTNVSMRNLSLTLDECMNLYYDVLYTESDYFYVASSFSYAMNGNYVSTFVIKYNYDTKEIDRMQQEFDDAVAAVVSEINPDWTDAETVLYLHDYLAVRCQYDLTYTYADAYSALVGGCSVCQGYALAMCVLCRAAGIPCYPVTSDELNHMWNAVQIDGNWYHCDITFDDNSPDLIGHAAHSYVLVSNDYMLADSMHNASDYNYFSDSNPVSCDSSAYEDAFWVGAIDAVTPLPDGTFLYAMMNDPDNVKTSSQIYADLMVASESSAPAALSRISASWLTERGTVYTTCYVSADVYGGKIYYHTRDSIYAADADGKNAQRIYTLTTEEKAIGSIYGILIDQKTGLLTYQIQDAPLFADETLTMNTVFNTILLEKPAEQTTAPPEETTTEAETTTSVAETTTTVSDTTAAVSETTATVSETTATVSETTATISETTATVSETTATVSETTTTVPETTVTSSAAETETTTFTVSETTEAVTTTTTAEPVLPVLRGDVDVNGRVNISDAILLAQFNAEIAGTSISRQGLVNADCNEDGSVNTDDATWILETLAGLI